MAKPPSKPLTVVRKRKPKVITFKTAEAGEGRGGVSVRGGNVEERVRVGKWVGAEPPKPKKKPRPKKKPAEQAAAAPKPKPPAPKKVAKKKPPPAPRRRKLTAEEIGPRVRRWPEPQTPPMPETHVPDRRFPDAHFAELQASLVEILGCAVGELPPYFHSQIAHPAAPRLTMRLCQRFGFGRRSKEAARVEEVLQGWFHSDPYYAAMLSVRERFNLDMAVEGAVDDKTRRIVRFYLAELHGDSRGMLLKRRGRGERGVAIPVLATVAQAIVAGDAARDAQEMRPEDDLLSDRPGQP